MRDLLLKVDAEVMGMLHAQNKWDSGKKVELRNFLAIRSHVEMIRRLKEKGRRRMHRKKRRMDNDDYVSENEEAVADEKEIGERKTEVSRLEEEQRKIMQASNEDGMAVSAVSTRDNDVKGGPTNRLVQECNKLASDILPIELFAEHKEGHGKNVKSPNIKCPACVYSQTILSKEDGLKQKQDLHVLEECRCYDITKQPTTIDELVDHIYDLKGNCENHNVAWWYYVRAAIEVIKFDDVKGRTTFVSTILERASWRYGEKRPISNTDQPNSDLAQAQVSQERSEANMQGSFMNNNDDNNSASDSNTNDSDEYDEDDDNTNDKYDDDDKNLFGR